MKGHKTQNRNFRRKRKSPHEPKRPPKLARPRSVSPVPLAEPPCPPQENVGKEEQKRGSNIREYSELLEKYRNDGVNQYTMLALKFMSQHSFAWSQMETQFIMKKLLHYSLFFLMSELEIAAWSIYCERGFCGIVQDFDQFLIVTALQTKEVLGFPEQVECYFKQAFSEHPSLKNVFTEWKLKNPTRLELAEVNRRYSECICPSSPPVTEIPQDYNKCLAELFQMTPYVSKEESKKFLESPIKGMNTVQKEFSIKEESPLEMSTKLEREKIWKDSPEVESKDRFRMNAPGTEEVERLYSFENLSREDNLMPHFLRNDTVSDFVIDELRLGEFMPQNDRGEPSAPLPAPGESSSTPNTETLTHQYPRNRIEDN